MNKNIKGDAINVMFAAVAFNFKRAMNALFIVIFFDYKQNKRGLGENDTQLFYRYV